MARANASCRYCGRLEDGHPPPKPGTCMGWVSSACEFEHPHPTHPCGWKARSGQPCGWCGRVDDCGCRCWETATTEDIYDLTKVLH